MLVHEIDVRDPASLAIVSVLEMVFGWNEPDRYDTLEVD